MFLSLIELSPLLCLQKKIFRKEEKAKANRFETYDHHNSEGQHKSYTRDLKYLPRAAGPVEGSEESAGTFKPILHVSDEAKEREGARKLANELRRRSEKKLKKRDRIEYDQTDVSYINQRNKRFNQKIARNFDKHTAEIRQNLERGTAL